MNFKVIAGVVFSAIWVFSASSVAQEIEAETLVEGLNHPSSLAIHPDDATVYVAEFGAARVVKIVEGKAVEVIKDFEANSFPGMNANGGPVALEFMNANKLLVASAGKKDSPVQVQGFDLSEIVEDKTLLAAESKAKLGMGKEDTALKGQINRMVTGSSSIFLVGQHGDEKAFVASLGKGVEFPAEMSFLVPENREAKKWLGSTLAVTLSQPEGYLAMVENSKDGATLIFFSKEGEENGRFETGLKRVTAIAYGTERGRLYLADSEKGAIYKLIESDNEAGCESQEVYELANITDMRFNADGELLVTTLGENVGEDSGKVIKLMGLDSETKKEESGE